MAVGIFHFTILVLISFLGSILFGSNVADLDLNITVHESVQAFESIEEASLSALNGFDVAFANMYILSNEALGFNIKITSSIDESCPNENNDTHIFCGSMGTQIPYGLYIAPPETSILRQYYLSEELEFSTCKTASTISSDESSFYVSGPLTRSNLVFNEDGDPDFVYNDKTSGKLEFRACIPDISSLMLREGERITVERITFIFDKAGS